MVDLQLGQETVAERCFLFNSESIEAERRKIDISFLFIHQL
jgi:hypothetical protein